ncbi:UNVERIFIED_CONTAM: hypothetical protein HDU68_009640 [Siphonaria sp. JEL0065]|nr:hypothetical protein HDU68_009640 [Siphonaria sp. JEL0065]
MTSSTVSDAAPQDVPNTTFQFVIAVYLAVWLVSLALVFVFTRREQVALVRDIRRLKNKLISETTIADNQQIRSNTPLVVQVGSSTPRTQSHQVVMLKDDDDEENDSEVRRRPLVVPSTPETKNLIMALANGEDFDFDLDLPENAYEDDENTGNSYSNKIQDVGMPLSNLNSLDRKKQQLQQPSHSPQMSLNRPESVVFVPSQSATTTQPHLLLRASAVPRIPNLWRRMFNISSAKFLPEDVDTASKHAPNSPARARFVEPLPPVTPLAARVHRLILSAIDADLRVLEARFKKDALTDLKAERAVLILSNKRITSRAPYYLTFQATTYTHHMSPSEFLCIPFVALFSWWAVPLAKLKYGASQLDETVHVCAPPRSLGGAVGMDEVASELNSSSACLVLNGRLHPTVWNVTAELRVPKEDQVGGGINVVVHGEEEDAGLTRDEYGSSAGILKKGGRMGTNDTVVV